MGTRRRADQEKVGKELDQYDEEQDSPVEQSQHGTV